MTFKLYVTSDFSWELSVRLIVESCGGTVLILGKTEVWYVAITFQEAKHVEVDTLKCQTCLYVSLHVSWGITIAWDTVRQNIS